MRRQSLGSARHGVTLAELLVVIVILGLIAGIAVHAFTPPPGERTEGRLVRTLMVARAEAIKTRRPVVVRLDDSSATGVATALPDGSIIGEARIHSRLHLSSLTGAAEVVMDSGASRD